MNYEDTRFLPMLKEFGGLRRLARGLDFKCALLLATVTAIICGISSFSKVVIMNLGPAFLSIGAALVAVIITGLAIIVSTSDNDFVRVLRKLEIYRNILFPFWVSAMLSGASVVINAIAYIATLMDFPVINFYGYTINSNNILFTFLLWLAFLTTFYALFAVISLIENAIKYGLYRGEVVELRSTLSKPKESISNYK